jgi:hypothetical protein
MVVGIRYLDTVGGTEVHFLSIKISVAVMNSMKDVAQQVGIAAA